MKYFNCFGEVVYDDAAEMKIRKERLEKKRLELERLEEMKKMQMGYVNLFGERLDCERDIREGLQYWFEKELSERLSEGLEKKNGDWMHLYEWMEDDMLDVDWDGEVKEFMSDWRDVIDKRCVYVYADNVRELLRTTNTSGVYKKSELL